MRLHIGAGTKVNYNAYLRRAERFFREKCAYIYVRAIIASLILSALAGCAPVCAPSQTTLAAELMGKTVALVAGPRNETFCSGVWVSKSEILTANHCVDESDVGDVVRYATPEDISLEMGGLRSSHDARLVEGSEDLDLALLRDEEAPAHGVARLASGDILPGQRVFTMGHPGGAVWSFSSGDVAAIRLIEGRWYVQSTAPITPGSSGGGLYDEYGRLVGITRMYLMGSQSVNFFVHRDYLAAFLAIAHAGPRS